MAREVSTRNDKNDDGVIVLNRPSPEPYIWLRRPGRGHPPSAGDPKVKTITSRSPQSVTHGHQTQETVRGSERRCRAVLERPVSGTTFFGGPGTVSRAAGLRRSHSKRRGQHSRIGCLNSDLQYVQRGRGTGEQTQGPSTSRNGLRRGGQHFYMLSRRSDLVASTWAGRRSGITVMSVAVETVLAFCYY